MMSFLNAVADRLEADVSIIGGVVYIGVSPQPESVAIRLAPATPGKKFYDKTATKNVMLQVLGKSADQSNLVNMMQLIDESLNVYDTSFPVTGWTLEKMETYTEPSFVELGDDGQNLYTALYMAQLNKGGI